MSYADTATPVLDPAVQEEFETDFRREAKLEKNWFVLLHDDQEHSYDYVVLMLVKLCAMTPQDALLHAVEVDTDGATIIACKPREEADALARQVARYGGDPLMGTACSMKATIEPAEG